MIDGEVIEILEALDPVDAGEQPCPIRRSVQVGLVEMWPAYESLEMAIAERELANFRTYVRSSPAYSAVLLLRPTCSRISWTVCDQSPQESG